MQNRLYRSQTNFVIGGVCGGLGKYLNIDPTLVRIFFVLFTLAGGAGPVVYLLLWLIIPKEGTPDGTWQNTDFRERAGQMRDEFVDFTHRPNQNIAMYVGIGLVALGVVYLLQALHIPWLRWLNQDIFWPALLIFGGAVLLWRALRGGNS